MTAPTRLHDGVPRRVLLATDLSARCDRALERAISLAAGWQASLSILHVFEGIRDPGTAGAGHSLPSWQRPPDALSIAKQRIRQGLRADLGDSAADASVLIEEGSPAEVIERVAAQGACELIVVAVAREEPFAPRPVTLGRTVERLLRRSPAPVLIVRDRARAPYGHILVATDFSAISGHALHAALRFFPLRTLHLLHAFEAPYADRVSAPADYEEHYGQFLASELETFLVSSGVDAEQRQRLDPLTERGRPGQLVREYVRDRGADLVVLGTHGRGAMLEALTGSTAKDILSTLPCDALVVRGPRQPSSATG